MARIRFGFPTRLFEMPVREAVGHVGELKVDGVQFDLRNELTAASLSDTGRRQLRNMLSEHNLKFAPAVFPLRRPLADLVGLEERMNVLTNTMRFAGELRIPGLVLRSGPLPSEDALDGSLLIELLNDLARVGNHVGVTPMISTGGESANRLPAVLGKVTTGPIAIAWDPAAVVMAGGTATPPVRGLDIGIEHVRLRDGFREDEGGGVETAVGRGEVPWEEVLANLAEMEYAGWMTPDRTGGDDMLGDARRAIQYVRNVLPF